MKEISDGNGGMFRPSAKQQYLYQNGWRVYSVTKILWFRRMKWCLQGSGFIHVVSESEALWLEDMWQRFRSRSSLPETISIKNREKTNLREEQ